VSEASLLDNALLDSLAQYDSLILGFSGGLDSTALLHLLAQYPALKNKLHAIYVDHGLSANSEQWGAHCQNFCKQLEICFTSEAIKITAQSNIESIARIKRYEIFKKYCDTSSCLLLAHHQDDQAETLLLQLARGTGITGMGAMQEKQSWQNSIKIRPFLSVTKAQLLNYAREHKLTWVDDESNIDSRFSRNFLRHQIIPLLKQQWPGVVKTLARASKHCQHANDCLEDLAIIDGLNIVNGNVIDIPKLVQLSISRQRNLVYYWLYNQVGSMPSEATCERIFSEIITAKQDAVPLVQWANYTVRRYQKSLYLVDELLLIDLPEVTIWHDFPNKVQINNLVLSTRKSSARSKLSIQHPKTCDKIEIKFRQKGEVILINGHSRRLKKLLQQWGVTPWLRDKIPLLYIGGELAAVIGHVVSDKYCSLDGKNSYIIDYKFWGGTHES